MREQIRNRILLLLYVIASGTFASFFGGYISYALFYLSLLIPLFSFCYLMYVYFKFRIYQLLDHKIVLKEEKVPYRFILANEDMFTFTNVRVSFREDYSYVEELSSKEQYTLSPGDRIEKETMITCLYRGEYPVGAQEVVVTDYLNLFSYTYSAPSPITVKVLPRVLHMKQLRFISDPEGRVVRNDYVSSLKIPDTEVRTYTSMDPIKMIHWKETARLSTLMTRKFTEEPKNEITIYFDLSKKEEASELERVICEDKMIECVLAVCDYFFRMRTTVRVIYESFGSKQIAITDKEGFNQFYTLCTDVRFRAEHTVDQLLKINKNQSLNSGTSIIITHTLSKELLICCYELMNLCQDVVLIYLGDDKPKLICGSVDPRITIVQITSRQSVTQGLERQVEA